jgi:hypothetical protein
MYTQYYKTFFYTSNITLTCFKILVMKYILNKSLTYVGSQYYLVRLRLCYMIIILEAF